ncbi:universal stress protein [Gelatiniphilus marinus]|uniref:Universal stress protein n=1 Tax=Gelatiniphilus marinus TaxID=1759464 RepID=A0ABW5JQZ6_9FLAO
MKHNILLPTDFSDNSWSAIVYALKLYAHEECTFYLLNSVAISVAMRSKISKSLLKTSQEEAKKELLNLKQLAQESNGNPNHDFKIILSINDLDKAINNAVINHDISLVIMGTKGVTGAKGFFFGSNTVRVISRFANCPVLVIPEDYDFVAPKQIAFPTDYNRFYGSNEIKPLTQMADLYNSKIRILHINENEELSEIQQFNQMMLQSYLNNNKYSLHWMPKYDKKTAEINDFIEELNINILAMVNYKHSFIENIVKEPIIKKIGFKPLVPFLVIPE